MSDRVRIGFTAGFIGAVILIVTMYLLQALGVVPEPMFVTTYRSIFGADAPMADLLGGLLFALSGGVWGAIFGALVALPTVGKGVAFSLLPTLWVWLVVAPINDQPLFNGLTPMGLLLPLGANAIWGAFVGWYLAQRVGRTAPARV